MASVTMSREWAERFRADLAHGPEEVGFFLADYDSERRNFAVSEWRSVKADDVASRSQHHVVLADEMRGELIRWAWSTGGALIEAHSHGRDGFAEFSGSDLLGFEEWVPHVRWRLRGRPYAAVVVANDRVDAMAWIDDAPEPVERIEVTGHDPIVPTGATIKWLRRNPHGV